jgi:hypothetical protein
MRGRWTMSVPMFRARGKGIGFICGKVEVGIWEREVCMTSRGLCWCCVVGEIRREG